MEEKRKLNPVILAIGLFVLVIVLALIIRSCVVPSETEQATMTAAAAATQAIMERKVAALTAVVVHQTETAMPTATPLPEYLCIDRGNFMGMAAVLEQFDKGYDENYTYEMCTLDDSGDVERCIERIALEKGEYGPIIPETKTWVIIPGVDQDVCDDNGGKWVLDASPVK
jgi:hypothetical protein